MTPTVLFVCSFHFTARDYSRLGAQDMAEKFPVRILDCGSWLRPETQRSEPMVPNHVIVRNAEEFVAALDAITGPAIAFDYFGDWPATPDILKELQQRNIARWVYVNGLIPTPTVPPPAVRLREAMHLPALPGKIAAKIRRCFPASSSPSASPPPDVVVHSGQAGVAPPLSGAKSVIWGHSQDYETFLALKQEGITEGITGENIAVFVDECMIDHPDYDFCKVRRPTTAKRYYESLVRFFDAFEAKTGLRIVFAAHPRGRYVDHPPPIGGREVIAGRIAELTAKARVVLSHASTSQAFAVMMRKPLILLTSDDLDKSWLSCHIRARASLLKAPILNIDHFNPNELDAELWNPIHESCYADYERMYIRTDAAPRVPLWPRLAQLIEDLN